MLSARYSPLVSQAEITGKGQPDLWSFNQREAHAGDAMYVEKSYRGVDHKENLAIMPGELVIGHRKRVGHPSFHGRSMEAGFSSVAGLYYGDHQTPESLMRDFYFMGVAKTEYQYGGESLFGTDPMDHGFGFLRAGSISINNNSMQDVHAGDLVAWRLPAFPNGDPRTQGTAQARSIDTGLNPRMSANRTGTPYSKPLVQIERFDPMDFSLQLAGAYSLFDKPASRAGVSDLKPADLFSDRKQLDSLQEEALGWKCGLLMAFARGLDGQVPGTGKTWAETNGVLSGQLTDQAKNVLDAMFLRNVAPGQNNSAIQNLRVADYSKLRPDSYEFYADHLFDMLCGSIASAWQAKAGRVIGKAMSNAKSAQTLDLMVSHFKVGF